MMRHPVNLLLLTLASLAAGCRSLTIESGRHAETSHVRTAVHQTETAGTGDSEAPSTGPGTIRETAHFTPLQSLDQPAEAEESDREDSPQPAADLQEAGRESQSLSTEPMSLPASGEATLLLRDVIESLLATFPLVRAAALQFGVAEGQLLSAEGAFDLKLKAASENGPLGFYETYRHSAGAVQPLLYGGEVFGGYRIGRGDFQPWYKERETDEGGEFKAGLLVPLARNTRIDDRRAGVQKAGIDLAAADPQFRHEVIRTVRAGTAAYWQWVAAGARELIAREVLALATTRNQGLQEEVKAGAKAPAVLQDNRRSILSREAKLIDARRKLQQAAAKLSIYLRTPTGQPRSPRESELPSFPVPLPPDEAVRDRLVGIAMQNRPELREIDLAIERLTVELNEARNDLRPNVDAVLIGSQDVGEPASKKRDKSELEIEAGLLVDVPLQRRKARGKIVSLEAKQSQLSHKRRLTADKVRTEIDVAYAALEAAYQRIQRTTEARELAEFMANVEREKLLAGESNLLSVALREQQAAEAAGTEVDAHLEYQLALAELRASAGIDDGSIIEWNP